MGERAILENLGVGTESQDGSFTLNNAGVLFFCPSIRRVCEQATITCAVFEGTKRIQVADRKDYDEDIVANIDNTLRFLRRELRVRYEMTGEARRKEIWELPIEALREAVVNAVAHRDYGVYGAHTTVDVFDDRVEISNPGGLVRGLTPESFGRRAIRRNQIVADLLHRLDLVENMGTGISKIRDLLTASGCPPAEYEFEDFFTATFRRPAEWQDGSAIHDTPGTDDKAVEKGDGGVNGGVNGGVGGGVADQEREMLARIRHHPGLRTPQLAEALHVSVRTAERRLAALQTNAMIEFRGSPKTGGYWAVAPEETDTEKKQE